MKKRSDDILSHRDGSSGDDNLSGNASDDHMHGGAGHDVINGNAGDDNLDGGAGNDVLNGGVGDDILSGGVGDDRLLGGAGRDRLFGGAGDDQMNGGLGVDHLQGGRGNDTYSIDHGNEISKSLSDPGIDRVVSSVSYALGNQQERLALSGSDDINGSGNAGNNILSGNSGDNRLSGGGGDDNLIGGAGDDDLRGGAGDDQLHGGSGNDHLHYDSADHRIDGGVGDDTLVIDGSGVALDLSTIAGTVATDIEEINLTGSGDNSITLSLNDVLAMSSSSDTLMLTGNAGDSVTSAAQGWVLQVGETEVEHGHSYDTYTSGLGTLLVDHDMTATLS